MEYSYAHILECYLINTEPAIESASDVVQAIGRGIRAIFKKIKDFFYRIKQKILDKIRKAKHRARMDDRTKPDNTSSALTKEAIALIQKTLDAIKRPTNTIESSIRKIFNTNRNDIEYIQSELESLDRVADEAISDMVDMIDQTIDTFNSKYKDHVDNDELYDGLLNWTTICIGMLETADRRTMLIIRDIESMSGKSTDIKIIGTRLSNNIAKYATAVMKLDKLINELI